MSNTSTSRLTLCFSYSSINLFMYHHWITIMLFHTRHLSLFLSVLSWHVTSECMMCWFIVKLHRHSTTMAEINPSDSVAMRLQVVCVVAEKAVSCHDTIITIPPLKMGSCAPFWQYISGPGAWLCTMFMVLLGERRKIKEMRDRWSGGQMNNVHSCIRTRVSFHDSVLMYACIIT